MFLHLLNLLFKRFKWHVKLCIIRGLHSWIQMIITSCISLITWCLGKCFYWLREVFRPLCAHTKWLRLQIAVSLLHQWQGGATRRRLCGFVLVGVVVKDLQLNENGVKELMTSTAAIHHLVCPQPLLYQSPYTWQRDESNHSGHRGTEWEFQIVVFRFLSLLQTSFCTEKVEYQSNLSADHLWGLSVDMSLLQLFFCCSLSFPLSLIIKTTWSRQSPHWGPIAAPCLLCGPGLAGGQPSQSVSQSVPSLGLDLFGRGQTPKRGGEH